MAFQKPCLKCKRLTRDGSVCRDCQTIQNRQRNLTRKHYKGDYARLAKAVRQNAQICWICGLGAIENDPWTADHYYPSDPNSPLLPAHRSCNSRRGNKPPEEVFKPI